MKKKNKDFKSLILPGRPRFGKELKRGKNLSLDQDVIAWLGEDNPSAKANTTLRQAMDKEDYDSQG